MSFTVRYVLYNSLDINCAWYVPKSVRTTDVESQIDANEPKRTISYLIKLQVLMPECMTADELLADVRLYQYIVAHWQSILAENPPAEIDEIYAFDGFAANCKETLEKSKKSCSKFGMFVRSDAADRWSFMKQVVQSPVYNSATRLLILPTVSFVVEPY